MGKEEVGGRVLLGEIIPEEQHLDGSEGVRLKEWLSRMAHERIYPGDIN